MTVTRLVFKYALFAVVAIFVNLALQRLVLHFVADWPGLILAIALGTGAGLVTKYLLDRHWIFYDRPAALTQQGRQFLLYTFTGIFTTLLFWGSELGAFLLWRTELAREGGAILGLVLGYFIKYQLDKRFVFNQLSAQPFTEGASS